MVHDPLLGGGQPLYALRIAKGRLGEARDVLRALAADQCRAWDTTPWPACRLAALSER